MSQSYTWASFEKNEEISYGWCGGRVWDSAWTGCKQNNAVLTLLAGRWSGDRLVWYGCEGFDFERVDTPFKKSPDDYDSSCCTDSAWYRHATRRLDALIGTNREGHIVERW